MKRFEVPGYDAPLVTRNDLLQETDRLLRPLLPLFSRGDTRIHLGNMSSGAPDSVSEIEGFSRILWAMAAMKELKADDPLWVKVRQGLIHGTNPEDPNYFGDLGDKEQRIVETAAIGYAFVLRPDCIYDPLSEEEQKRLIAWLDGVNHKEAHPCNWKFFRVMVNIGFKALGLSYNKEAMEAHLEDIEAYYVGNGWYRDGELEGSHAEYYIPFAMHYYGLFYAMTMEDVDPERAAIYKQRAREFADDFIYWFSSDGAALPYGRSLTYRFAQVGFWSMMVVAGVECQWSLGQIKGLIMRHFRWWKQQPYLDPEGRMTMGYAYPNPFMTEEYNAPGSVYWSLKSMVILALDAEHPFWQAEEEDMPSLDKRHKQDVPRFILTRDDAGKHVLAYNGGNYHTNGHTHVECKYEKFVYSTYFGFSVPP